MIIVNIGGLITLAVFLLYILYLLIYFFIYRPIKAHLFGYSYYKYEKLLSTGGIATKYMWHKTDDEALKHYNWYEFAEIIYPQKHKRRVRPERHLN